jgi:hypothetical protein
MKLFAPTKRLELLSTVLETGMLPLHQTDVLCFIVCESVLTLLHYYKTSVGKRGFEPIFSTSYLTPMYQIGWILANLYYYVFLYGNLHIPKYICQFQL